MVVAPGRMIDSFLSIPNAESMPLYRMVLKLACVCVDYDIIFQTYDIIVHIIPVHGLKKKFTAMIS